MNLRRDHILPPAVSPLSWSPVVMKAASSSHETQPPTKKMPPPPPISPETPPLFLPPLPLPPRSLHLPTPYRTAVQDAQQMVLVGREHESFPPLTRIPFWVS